MKKLHKRLIAAVIVLLAADLYYIYIWRLPCPVEVFLQKTAPRVSVIEVRSYNESVELDAEQRAALLALLQRTEIRRYAFWEPWDSNTRLTLPGYADIYFYPDHVHPDYADPLPYRIRIPFPSAFLLGGEIYFGNMPRYCLPQDTALFEQILAIAHLEIPEESNE